MSSARKHQGRTNRFSLAHDLEIDLQSPVSYGHDLLTRKSYQRLVGSENRVKTNGLTYGRK